MLTWTLLADRSTILAVLLATLQVSSTASMVLLSGGRVHVSINIHSSSKQSVNIHQL